MSESLRADTLRAKVPRLNLLVSVGALIALFGLPMVLQEFHVHLLTRIIILASFAIAYNLLFGFAGLPAFGPVVFYGLGAYGFLLAVNNFGGSLLVAVPVAVLAAFAYSALVGFVSVRGIGIYFALLTFTFAHLVFVFAKRFPSITGGDDGILLQTSSLPIADLITNTTSMYFIAAGMMVGLFLIVYQIRRSPFGRVLRAVRFNADRAESLGYPVNRVKVTVFAISSTMCAVPGILYVLNNRFVSPEVLQYTLTIDVMIATLIGGLATLTGPILGAFVIVMIEHFSSDYAHLGLIIMGSLLITVIFFLPEGVVSLPKRLKGLYGTLRARFK
jgi:branched-chain amino acid transport system permease protein